MYRGLKGVLLVASLFLLAGCFSEPKPEDVDIIPELPVVADDVPSATDSDTITGSGSEAVPDAPSSADTSGTGTESELVPNV